MCLIAPSGAHVHIYQMQMCLISSLQYIHIKIIKLSK